MNIDMYIYVHLHLCTHTHCTRAIYVRINALKEIKHVQANKNNPTVREPKSSQHNQHPPKNKNKKKKVQKEPTRAKARVISTYSASPPTLSFTPPTPPFPSSRFVIMSLCRLESVRSTLPPPPPSRPPCPPPHTPLSVERTETSTPLAHELLDGLLKGDGWGHSSSFSTPA